MVTYIKKNKSNDSNNIDDVNVKKTVENILSDIRENGDRALRKYSTKFDKWNPSSFLLTRDEILSAQSKLLKSQIEDIKFAQKQIKNFAEHQLCTINDLEVETLPGVF